jgi:hypothetical protein
MAQPAHVVPDPGLFCGPYRILTRTDGRWVVVDERMPPGARSAAIVDTKDAALAEAKRLVALGSPSVVAAEPSTRRPR